jgi:TolB-like protein/Flp pilus assembly protein TadD
VPKMPVRGPQVLGPDLKYPEIAAMTVASDQSREVAFGPFRLDSRGRVLYRDGVSVALGTRGIDILCALTASRGALVTKDQLISKVWSGAIVEDNAIQAQVSALRKALKDGKGGQRYIVTVPGQGYRFVAEPAAPRDPLLDKPSIAVLPFDNMSGEPSQDYFVDGVVEDIITALTRVPSLQVVARNSSFAYKGRAVDIRQVGRELSVRYVLEGSVRKAGGRLRITGQLLQAETGVHLWAEKFDGNLADVFALQDEITARVVGALVPNLQGAEIARAHRKPSESLDAYDLYLRALACRNTLTAEATDEALRLLERALALDPTFVSAAAFAGTMWAVRIQHGWLSSLEHAQTETLRYARMAVRLDPHDAESLATLARWTAMCTRDYSEARQLADRAIALDPHSARAWRSSGFIYLYMDEAELALDHLQRGLRFHPRDIWVHDSWSGVALAQLTLGRHEDAVAAARMAVQLNPRYVLSLRIFAAALAMTGHIEDAKDVMRQHRDIDPNCTISALSERIGYSAGVSTRFFEGLRRAGMPE